MKKKICIIYGGETIEASYSKKAFENVYNEISNKYEVIGIDFVNLLNDINIWDELKEYDEIVNLVYGVPGQDGLVASLLEARNIGFKGSCNYTCSLIKDKFFAKLVCNSIGIKTPKSYIVNCEKSIYTIDEIGFDLPVVVKPRRKGGLSLGISYCESLEEINKAIIVAGQYDDKLLIEEYIRGKEVTTCIIVIDKKIIFLPIIEIKKQEAICDCYTKINNKRNVDIDPPIEHEIKLQLEKITKKIFKTFDMEDYGYFDFIIMDKDIFFIEAGAVPGLTRTSNIPMLMNYKGISLEKLFK